MRQILLILLLIFTGNMASAQSVTVGIKNFRSMYRSLSTATGVAPTQGSDVQSYYLSSMSRLPKEGRVTEFSGPVALTFTGLAGLFCKHYVAREGAAEAMDPTLAPLLSTFGFNIVKDEDMVTAAKSFARVFWRREASEKEVQTILTPMKKSMDSPQANGKTALLVGCTVAASSIDFLVKE